jgi:hypothetical protein
MVANLALMLGEYTALPDDCQAGPDALVRLPLDGSFDGSETKSTTG